MLKSISTKLLSDILEDALSHREHVMSDMDGDGYDHYSDEDRDLCRAQFTEQLNLRGKLAATKTASLEIGVNFDAIREYLRSYMGDLAYQQTCGIDYINSCTCGTSSFADHKECDDYLNKLELLIDALPERDDSDDFKIIGAIRDYEAGKGIKPSIQFAVGDASPHALVAITDNWTGTPTFCGTRDGSYWEILRKEELLNL